MNIPRTLLLASVVALVGLTACGKKETLRFESGPVELTAEGPLFEGSNTAQGTWRPDLEAFLKTQGATLDQLREARVLEAVLATADSIGFQGIRSASLMFASDAQDMQQVAVLNPFPQDQDRAVLTVANEQKGLAGHLKQQTLTVVADLDLGTDSDEDRHVIGSFTLELTIAR